MNIELNYCYRDGANYKQFGSIIFANANALSAAELDLEIRGLLIDECWFDAALWGLPTLYRYAFDPAIDHGWHEFEEVAMTTAPPTMDVDVADWLAAVRKQSRQYM